MPSSFANPITEKKTNKQTKTREIPLVIQPSFRAVGQTNAKRQTFEKPENKKQMAVRPDCHTFVSYLYDSKAWVD